LIGSQVPSDKRDVNAGKIRKSRRKPPPMRRA
jgi:hypothetical protein